MTTRQIVWRGEWRGVSRRCSSRTSRAVRVAAVGGGLAALALASAALAQPRPPRPGALQPRSAPPPPSAVVYVSGFGMPLAALLDPQNAADLQLFADGQADFLEVEELPLIGPLFNSRSCGSCHFQPALGGSGAFINEMRVRDNTASGPLHIFASDNMLRGGPQSQGPFTIFGDGLVATPIGCQITSPKCRKSRCQREEMRRTTFRPTLKICDPSSASFAAGANCVGERQSTPLFGLGFVEAVADGAFDSIAAAQPPPIRGVVKRVNEIGALRVGRFGWKNDHATLRAFAADAYLNEMGVTSPDFPDEVSTCALDKVMFGVLLDTGDDPEDATEEDGRNDVDRFADFIRALEPPPHLADTPDAQAGHALFNQIGCGGCHLETLTTAGNPASFVPPTTGGIPVSSVVSAALAGQNFHPFSDFLLHDMGSLGDGITSGDAGPRQMRTSPLWGLRGRSRFLHDGRATSAADAISLHDGQGRTAAQAYRGLTPAEQQQLLDFLDTI